MKGDDSLLSNRKKTDIYSYAAAFSICGLFIAQDAGTGGRDGVDALTPSSQLVATASTSST